MRENKRYTAINKDGMLCTYDGETHKCIGVMFALGCDPEYYKTHIKEWIGQLDPKYEKSEK